MVEQVAGEEEPPDVVLRHLAFVRLSEGRLAARGTAAEARYHQSASRVEARALAVELPPGVQAPADVGHIKLTAPQAAGDLAARTGLGWGGVLADAERGDHAATERVHIDGPRNLVVAPGAVQARGPGYAIRGAALTASADGKTITLRGGVTGRLTPAAHAAPPVKPPARVRKGKRGAR